MRWWRLLTASKWRRQSPAPARSISLIEDGACCIFAGENRQLMLLRTPYPNYYFKEQKMFFFCHNNYHCFRQNFRTILHWHWYAFSWPLMPASNDGKIITFLPSTCEWSRYRRLHVVGRLLVVITSFWPLCDAAFILSTKHAHTLLTAGWKLEASTNAPVYTKIIDLIHIQIQFNI